MPPANEVPPPMERAVATAGAMCVIDWNRTSGRPIASRSNVGVDASSGCWVAVTGWTLLRTSPDDPVEPTTPACIPGRGVSLSCAVKRGRGWCGSVRELKHLHGGGRIQPRNVASEERVCDTVDHAGAMPVPRLEHRRECGQPAVGVDALNRPQRERRRFATG